MKFQSLLLGKYQKNRAKCIAEVPLLTVSILVIREISKELFAAVEPSL